MTSISSRAVLVGLVLILLGSMINANVVLAKKSDSGSSDGGGSSDKGSKDSHSDSNSDSGNSDHSDSNKQGHDSEHVTINDPTHPSKDDTKDTSDNEAENTAPPFATTNTPHNPDSNIIPNPSPPSTTTPNNNEPIIKCHGHCPHPPKPPTNNVNIFITIKTIIHKAGSNGHGSSNSNTHYTGLSQACTQAIGIAWMSKIQRGQDAEVDSFISKCLGVA